MVVGGGQRGSNMTTCFVVGFTPPQVNSSGSEFRRLLHAPTPESSYCCHSEPRGLTAQNDNNVNGLCFTLWHWRSVIICHLSMYYLNTCRWRPCTNWYGWCMLQCASLCVLWRQCRLQGHSSVLFRYPDDATIYSVEQGLLPMTESSLEPLLSCH